MKGSIWQGMKRDAVLPCLPASLPPFLTHMNQPSISH